MFPRIILLLSIIWLIAIETTAQPAPRSILDQPVGFEALETASLEITGATEVRVGFFGPADPDNPIGEAMWRGALLAQEIANASGGYKGRPFRLVARWDENPWKGGSREAVRLIYEDHVIAVIGGPDGASTHVLEQVATKTFFPLLSPVSGDPSLTHTAVPWMFRLAPSDAEQARVMVSEIQSQGLKRVAVMTSTDHDGRVGSDAIIKSLKAAMLPPVHHTEFTPGDYKPEDVAARVAASTADALVLWCPSTDALRIIASIGKQASDPILFVPAYPIETGIAKAAQDAGLRLCQVSILSESTEPAWIHFQDLYNNRYKVSPPPAAAYSYDAMNLIIRAVRQAGLNRARVRDSLAADSGYAGATGAIHWDNGGGNTAKPELFCK